MNFVCNHLKSTFVQILILLLFTVVNVKGQQVKDSILANPVTYPKITGYVGIIHPLISFSKDGTVKNFSNSYIVGMPTGINIIKSAKIGFSVEFVPFIRTANGISKMSNFLFHPGVLFPVGKGYTLVGRAAFETTGRFGITPVVNKVVRKNKNSSYFIAIPMPLRFGNDTPASFTLGFQFGIAF